MSSTTAIVVGGGSGIGADCARKLAADGAYVAVMSSSGKGEALANELGGFGLTGSNRNPADLSTLVSEVIERRGQIDTVVNCTGHGPSGPLIEIADEEWIEGMEIYLLNVIRMARLVTPHMQARQSGSIVNISTYAAFEPEAAFPTSGVFRAGLAAYTKLYADRYAADNIRMNNVLPGFTNSLAEKEDRLSRIPMGRYADVREVSEVVAFLASEKSAYVTGQNIRVDGGITRSV